MYRCPGAGCGAAVDTVLAPAGSSWPQWPHQKAWPGSLAKMVAPHLGGSLGKGGQTPHSSRWWGERCEEQPCGHSGMRRGALGAQAEALQSMETHGGASISLQPVDRAMLEHVSTLQLWGTLCQSTFILKELWKAYHRAAERCENGASERSCCGLIAVFSALYHLGYRSKGRWQWWSEVSPGKRRVEGASSLSKPISIVNKLNYFPSGRVRFAHNN